jgi:hypothetical protein
LIEVNLTTGRAAGNGTFIPFFGVGIYDLQFNADFSDAEVETRALENNRAGNEPKNRSLGADGIDSSPSPPARARTQFFALTSIDKILAQVSVRFLSVGRMSQNAEQEILSFSFHRNIKAAENGLRSKILVISVDAVGVSDDL